MQDRELEELTASPARLRILEAIAARGPMSFSELKRETGLSVGSIYYHLSRLREQVRQGKDRKYVLTEKGRRVMERVGSVSLAPPAKAGTLERSLRVAMLAPLIERMVRGARSSAMSLALTLLLGAVVHLYAGTNQVLLASPDTPLLPPALSVVISGWLPIFLLAEAFAIGVTGMRRGGELELGACIALSALPLHLYALLVREFLEYSRVALVPLQLWSATLLAAGLNLSKGVKLVYALVFSLFILYASIYVWLLVGA